MKKYALLVSVLALMVAAVSANASLNIFGTSGLIETPDDTIVAPSTLALTVNWASDLGGGDEDLTTYGGAFGLFRNFEVGAVGLDFANDTEFVLNAKYRLMDESYSRPSITVGVLDLLGNIDIEDDPSLYVVFGKNITSFAEGVSGGVSKPVRGYLGFGTNFYKGVFVGLNWSLTDQFDLMAEYLSEGITDGDFNAALQWRPVGGLAVKAGTIDFDGLYVGASYNLATY